MASLKDYIREAMHCASRGAFNHDYNYIKIEGILTDTSYYAYTLPEDGWVQWCITGSVADSDNWVGGGLADPWGGIGCASYMGGAGRKAEGHVCGSKGQLCHLYFPKNVQFRIVFFYTISSHVKKFGP